jgi:hypothetical protein
MRWRQAVSSGSCERTTVQRPSGRCSAATKPPNTSDWKRGPPKPRPGGGPPVPGWGNGARAILYEGHELTGRAFVIDHDVVPDLDRSGFNDRARSLRVEGGYWVFCSDAHFEGECLTFGPGDYPNLPRELDGRVSSGRRISNNYPYKEGPRWGR